MEPEYAVGDILISHEKAPEEIEIGDNIVYLGKEGGYAGKIITHAVIGIGQNEKGDYLFHTKGRANTVEDPIVHEDQLYGTIVQNNIVLAWLCKILTNRYGLYFFAIVPIILWAFIGFVKAQSEKIEQEKQEEFERRKRQEAKRKKRRQMERQRRRVVEVIEDDDEIIEETEVLEDEEIVEDEFDEEVIEVKPKTTKKTTPRKSTASKPAQKKTTAKTKQPEESEEIKEKPKKTTKSSKTSNSKTTSTASEKKKTQSKKKAKEE